jgi:ATP-dependent Clp protease ATP-binding subunit ClpX
MGYLDGYLVPVPNANKDVYRAMAEKAMEAGTGARALRMILEDHLRDLMFEVPTNPEIVEILIERETITEHREPIIKKGYRKEIA